MLSALLYLQYHSFKNRLVRRIQRLKQPKYLVGGIVGLLYVYFYFGRFLFGLGKRPQPGGALVAASGGYQFLIESGAAVLLFGAVLLAWLLPNARAALAFTETEVAFLFPAPVSRRGLIHFRLLRSQLAAFFTTVVLLLFTRRWGGNVWFHALGWWVVISALSLHGLGSSFARTMLLDHGITNRARRFVILGAVALLAVVTCLWARFAIPPPSAADLQDGTKLHHYAEQVLKSGPLTCLLFPFRLLIRPFFATEFAGFLGAMAPVLVILAALYVWVVRSDVAFEEASAEAAQKLAVRLAAIRSGNWRAANKQAKPKRAPFTLRPTGPPAIAFLWKNIISAGNVFTSRLLIILTLGITAICLVLRQTSDHKGTALLGMFSGMAVLWSLMLGPQILRQDFRQDLLLADVLKMYPVPAWQLALGELLGPVVILTAIDWLLLLIAGVLLSQVQRDDFSGALAVSIALGAACVVPMLNLIIFQIPNAAALLFPAWFLASRTATGGIEAMGQRIIFFFGQFLALVITLLPAAIVFTGVFFLGRSILSPALVIPPTALAAALVLGVEAAFGIVLLGRFFSRFDVASEMTP